MPAGIIILAHPMQGLSVTYMVEFSNAIPLRAEKAITFCSACTDSNSPHFSLLGHVQYPCSSNPNSVEFFNGPLQPEDIIVLSFMIRQPTFFLLHLDRKARVIAIFMNNSCLVILLFI